MLTRIRHIIMLLAALACLQMHATEPGMEIIGRFDKHFSLLDSLIFTPARTSEAHDSVGLPSALGLSRHVAFDSIYDSAVRNRTEKQISVIDAATGLQATGQVYGRLDNAFKGIDTDDDPISIYYAKVQAELRWYFLQSRLFKHDGRAREHQLQGQIDILAHEKERLDLTVYRQKELLRWRSDSLLAGVLIRRVANLALLQEANMYLLSNENIPSDELLKIIDERATAERQLAMMSGDFPAASTLWSIDSWVVEIDTVRLLRHIEDSQIDLQLMQLRMQLLEQQADNESWWSTTRIAPFVRYSGYYTSAKTISTNIDAGVSFTIPINTQSSRTRDAIIAQKEVVEAEAIDVKEQVRDKVRFITQEIARLNRASEAEVQRLHDLKEYLIVRGVAYANRMGEYSRLARMKEYNSYIACLEKLIEFQYRRDSYIADLQAFLIDGSILQYCIPKSIDEQLHVSLSR